MAIYQHIRHPRIASRLADRPVKVADLLPRGTAVNRFSTQVTLLVTRVVGSMWCAYAFAIFDLISLPDAIRAGPAPSAASFTGPRGAASGFSRRSADAVACSAWTSACAGLAR